MRDERLLWFERESMVVQSSVRELRRGNLSRSSAESIMPLEVEMTSDGRSYSFSSNWAWSLIDSMKWSTRAWIPAKIDHEPSYSGTATFPFKSRKSSVGRRIRVKRSGTRRRVWMSWIFCAVIILRTSWPQCERIRSKRSEEEIERIGEGSLNVDMFSLKNLQDKDLGETYLLSSIHLSIKHWELNSTLELCSAVRENRREEPSVGMSKVFLFFSLWSIFIQTHREIKGAKQE